jgi:hypothetical protein
VGECLAHHSETAGPESGDRQSCPLRARSTGTQGSSEVITGPHPKVATVALASPFAENRRSGGNSLGRGRYVRNVEVAGSSPVTSTTFDQRFVIARSACSRPRRASR